MPVDDYGIRADYIIDPITIVNRMNPGQLYDHFINRTSVFVARQMEDFIDTDDKISYVLEYINYINPNYAKLIADRLVTESDKELFIDRIRSDGIYLVIPPFLNTMTPELMLFLEEKYKSHATPVEYNLRDENGNLIRRVRTMCPAAIGSKYVYLLYKLPNCKSPGVGYINQYKTPDRPSALAKHRSLVGQTPLRLGEDENRNLTMVVGSETTSRLMNIHANSSEGVDKLVNDLLTLDKPSKLNHVDISNDQLTNTNHIIHITKHMFATIGIDAVNTTIGGKKVDTI